MTYKATKFTNACNSVIIDLFPGLLSQENKLIVWQFLLQYGGDQVNGGRCPGAMMHSSIACSKLEPLNRKKENLRYLQDELCVSFSFLCNVFFLFFFFRMGPGGIHRLPAEFLCILKPLQMPV